MATKDPHIAMIDAHEKLDLIKQAIRAKVAQLQARGTPPTEEDRAEIASFRQKMIDATRRVQDEFYDELNSHGVL